MLISKPERESKGTQQKAATHSLPDICAALLDHAAVQLHDSFFERLIDMVVFILPVSLFELHGSMGSR